MRARALGQAWQKASGDQRPLYACRLSNLA